MLGVFGVVSPRRQGDFRQGLDLHRVEEDGGQIPLRQGIYRAERELRLHVVVDGVIPPEAKRPPVERISFRERLIRQRPLRHAVTRVEHQDVVRKPLGERIRVGLARAAFLHVCVEVLRRHRQEGADVRVAPPQLARDVAQKGRLACAVLVLDVIKEDGEVAHTERVERLEFREHLLAVGIALVTVQRDIEPRRDGKDEAHVLRLGRLHERAEFPEFVLRVRFAPFLAVVWVILRRVEIGVEALSPAERENVEPLFLLPRRAVEALDDTAQRHG